MIATPLSQNQIVESIQSILRKLREESREHRVDFALDRPVFTEKRATRYKSTLVNKWIVFLRGSGCSAIQKNGGCTFCGFYTATNHGTKISSEKYIDQFFQALEENSGRWVDTPIISLYNDGSMLSESEIDFSTVLDMVSAIQRIPEIEVISLESKLIDITEEKIRRIRERTDKAIEISFGFESANPTVRRLCINKNFRNDTVIRVTDMIHSLGARSVALVMLKPPFLTEKEAVADALGSLEFLEATAVDRIDLELPTVEEYTLTSQLWRRGYFQPIRLWSVYHLLQARARLGLRKDIYISPTNYTVESLALPTNACGCDSDFFAAFQEFNRTNDLSAFSSLSCNFCGKLWGHDSSHPGLEGIDGCDGNTHKMTDSLTRLAAMSLEERIPFILGMLG